MSNVQVVMQPRNASIAEAIEDYAEARISYLQLERKIAGMGYSTRSLYEMVCHIQPKARKYDEDI